MPVIPAKRNRRIQIISDGAIHALRNRIERAIAHLKNARRVATRYDKTATSYPGFIHLTAIRLWLRRSVNTAQSASPQTLRRTAQVPSVTFPRRQRRASPSRAGS